jgi:hypothetical protein
MSEDSGKSGRCPAVLAASVAALTACCIPSFAKDEGVIQDTIVVARASSGALNCEIRKNEADGAVALTGFITSSTAIAGSFRFLVIKSGSSGSSNINQGQKFELAAGKDARAGQVKINLEHDAQVTVELIATSSDGIECRAKAMLGS